MRLITSLPIAFATTLLSTTLSTAAAAQLTEEGDFNAERFRPAMDRNGIIDVESGLVGDHLTYDATLFLGYASNPLTLISVNAANERKVDALIAHRLGANLIGSISLYEWVELGLDIPLVLFQARDADTFREQVQSKDTSAVGLGDIRFSPKVRLLRAKDGLIDLAIIPTVTLPTGVPFNSYFGDAGFNFVPELAASGSTGPYRFAINLAARLRPEREFINLHIGPEFIARGGVAWNIAELGVPLELGASVSSVTSMTQPLDPFSSGFEVAGGATYDLPIPALQVFGDVGVSPNAVFGMPTARVIAGLRWSPREPTVKDIDRDGVEDSADGCPQNPEDKDGLRDNDGCPEDDADADGVLDASDKCQEQSEDQDGFEDGDGCVDADNDGDGVIDNADPCKDQPEDKDGDRDDDGCPEGPADADADGVADPDDLCPALFGSPGALKGCPDADRDGIIDPNDKCPAEPETVNGNQDDDGCPDAGATKVNVSGGAIEITEKIYFETDEVTIQKRSFALLDQVARVIANRVERVSIEGHTDDAGDHALNLQVSKARAAAVRQHLITVNGIDPAVLVAVGYGDTKPIATNKTEAGRERNRRVEFIIPTTP